MHPRRRWWRRWWPLRGPFTWRKGLVWALAALVGWLALSLVLFMVSAWTREGSVSDATKRALDGGGLMPFTASTVLVLGSDKRSKRTHEAGACFTCPSRSDVMLLIRTGGGHAARLSIPRDTVVSIPGHGVAKINAAYAFGGAALAIETVKQYLGIPINHVVEVNFDNFPQLIDAMGGVDYSGGCVVSKINGGTRNGGYTLRLKAGTTHINGKQALALARTRHNDCHPGESDLTRVQRQQQLFQAMKSRLLSVSGFIRLPWISWNTPPALKSDMGGPTLLGLFGGLAMGGTPGTHFLRPSGTMTLPDGGVGLVVSDAERRLEVQQFENG
jgi:LCP family protein required for cell wall assembly